MTVSRDKLTAKLGRIAQAAIEPDLPFDVKGIYVFGSYARGALECGDLDLVVHADVTTLQERRRQWRKGADIPEWDFRRGGPSVEAAVRKGLGAQWGLSEIDIFLVSSPEGLKEKLDKFAPKLVWSPEQPDWQANIEAIRPDPTAGRFQRDHFVNVKRTRSTLETMEFIMTLLKLGEIVLKSRPLDTATEPPLSPEGAARLEQLRANHKSKTLKLVPHMFRWFLDEGVEPYADFHLTTWSSRLESSARREAHLGRINLHWMLSRLERPFVAKVCLIPHIARGKTSALHVFTRGPAWVTEDTARSRHWQDLRRQAEDPAANTKGGQ